MTERDLGEGALGEAALAAGGDVGGDLDAGVGGGPGEALGGADQALDAEREPTSDEPAGSS